MPDDPKRAKIEAYLWSVLRIILGLMFALHGAQKLFGLWGLDTAQLTTQLRVGAVLELVGGVLFSLGALTRAVAFVLAGQMAVAYFQFHVGLPDNFKGIEYLLPITNHGEESVLYCFIFLYAMIRGPGPVSLDHALGIKIVWPA